MSTADIPCPALSLLHQLQCELPAGHPDQYHRAPGAVWHRCRPCVHRLEFPPPALKPLSMNDRHHHRVRAQLTKRWRVQTRIFAAEQLVGTELGPSIVHVEIPVIGAARRDPHNYFATVKPIVDGLVDAGAWPDDTPAHVTTVEPTLHVYARVDAYRRRVRVTITPREARP